MALNVGLALGLAVSAAFGLGLPFNGRIARERGAGTAWIAVKTEFALAGGLFATGR